MPDQEYNESKLSDKIKKCQSIKSLEINNEKKFK